MYKRGNEEDKKDVFCVILGFLFFLGQLGIISNSYRRGVGQFFLGNLDIVFFFYFIQQDEFVRKLREFRKFRYFICCLGSQEFGQCFGLQLGLWNCSICLLLQRKFQFQIDSFWLIEFLVEGWEYFGVQICVQELSWIEEIRKRMVKQKKYNFFFKFMEKL